MVFQTLFKNKSAIEKLKLHSALLWPGLDLTLLSLTDAHKWDLWHKSIYNVQCCIPLYK